MMSYSSYNIYDEQLYILFIKIASIKIKSKFVCKFPQLERADYIIRVTFDTGFG